MKRNRFVHLLGIIVFALFCLPGISCRQVEAKLNSGNIAVTSQRLANATVLGDKTTWVASEQRFIPLGTEVSLCWDDIGLDLNETETLTVTITDPNGKQYDGLGWTIFNYYPTSEIGTLVGWSYIRGPGHSSYGTVDLYLGDIPGYKINTSTADKGVKFYGYAAITFSEDDPTGLYTGTIRIGDEELTKSWYMIDQPISILSNLADQNPEAGNSASFTVSATGSNLTYQWFYNTTDSYEGGIAIEGATDATYTISKVPAEYDGRYYYCQVSNYSSDDRYGMITKDSSRAQLTIKAKSAVSEPSASQSSQTVKKLNIIGKLLSVKSRTKRRIEIKWKKLKGISGYQLYISKDKKFRKSVIRRTYTAKKQSVKISNLLSGKKYFIKIRPYKNVKGSAIYGNWSKVKKIKVK